MPGAEGTRGQREGQRSLMVKEVEALGMRSEAIHTRGEAATTGKGQCK